LKVSSAAGDHRVHRDRDEIHRWNVSALSAGAYTATLYVMVNSKYIEKGMGVHPHPDQPGQIYPS